MKEDKTYHYALRQEVLKEAAADEFNKLVSYMSRNNLSEDDDSPCARLFWEISSFKKDIISDKNNDDVLLDGISTQIKSYRCLVFDLINK